MLCSHADLAFSQVVRTGLGSDQAKTTSPTLKTAPTTPKVLARTVIVGATFVRFAAFIIEAESKAAKETERPV